MSDDFPAPETRVALITGAAGGLGTALVGAFHAAGWQVVAGVHRTPPPWNSERITPLTIDVTQSDSVAAAAERFGERWGRLDVLINNAGIALDAALPSMALENWDAVMDVNLRGAFLCARAFLPGMLSRQAGHILNIASYGGRVGRAGQVNYAASKAGLLGLTMALAREVGSEGVQVNAVLPGFLRTPMVGALTEQQLAQHAAMNTLGRLNETGEVARFVVGLAAMRNVSGQLFQLDSRIVPWG